MRSTLTDAVRDLMSWAFVFVCCAYFVGCLAWPPVLAAWLLWRLLG